MSLLIKYVGRQRTERVPLLEVGSLWLAVVTLDTGLKDVRRDTSVQNVI